jgi:hypothetical protein
VDRDPVPLTQALCWAHWRRKFFVLADIATNAKRGKNAAPISPIALEAVKRIDAVFNIGRQINGPASDERLERRRRDSQPLASRRGWSRSCGRISNRIFQEQIGTCSRRHRAR